MSNRCPRCEKAVYYAEEVRAVGAKWHKLCLSCAKCHRLLDSTTVTDHNGEIYCRPCHGKNFGPKGYGFAGGASGLSMDTGHANILSRENVPHGLAKAQMPHLCSNNANNNSEKSQFGGSERCPRCDTRVYMAEKVIGAGQAYHKSCFKCSTCNKMLDSTTVTDRDYQIYCKACYNKQFGPKGFGYGQALQRTT